MEIDYNLYEWCQIFNSRGGFVLATYTKGVNSLKFQSFY